MAKLSIEEIIAAVKELTVLELNDLVKAAEEEFGVSAAAGVAVVAAGGAAEAAEEILKNATVFKDIIHQGNRKSCAYLPYQGLKQILKDER